MKEEICVENRTENKEAVTKEQAILNNIYTGLKIAGVAACIGVGAYLSYKTHTICKKVGYSLNDLSRVTHVDISSRMVDQYTEKAVQKAARNAAEKASDKLYSDAYDILSDQVAEAVKNSYDSIKDQVSREVRRQVSKISISALKSEIKEDVKDAITDRLSDQMDDILDTYNDQLTNIGKIYSSIAETMKEKA